MAKRIKKTIDPWDMTNGLGWNNDYGSAGIAKQAEPQPYNPLEGQLQNSSKYLSMLNSGDTGLSEVMKQNLSMGMGFDDALKNATANRNFASGTILDQSDNGTGQWSDWFKDKGNQAMLGFGLDAGKLGLGLASYLSQSDFMNKQGKLIDQQIANNQYEMDRRKGFSQGIADPNGAFATSYNAVRNA